MTRRALVLTGGRGDRHRFVEAAKMAARRTQRIAEQAARDEIGRENARRTGGPAAPPPAPDRSR